MEKYNLFAILANLFLPFPICVSDRDNPKIKQFYGRLIALGKLEKVALTACMRKLLTMINAIVRENQPWTPDYA